MSFSIAVAGKGGSGKTSVTSLIIRYLKNNKLEPILAIDADPNANLGESLGLKVGQTMGSIIASFNEEKIKIPELAKVFVINVGDDEKIVIAAMEVAQKLRALGINTRMNLVSGRLGKVLTTANKLNVPFAVIIGEDELKGKEITLRDMRTGKQSKIKLSKIESLKKLIA